jgi:hypothetical protein
MQEAINDSRQMWNGDVEPLLLNLRLLIICSFY